MANNDAFIGGGAACCSPNDLAPYDVSTLFRLMGTIFARLLQLVYTTGALDSWKAMLWNANGTSTISSVLKTVTLGKSQEASRCNV
jgi:hypothetical protein